MRFAQFLVLIVFNAWAIPRLLRAAREQLEELRDPETRRNAMRDQAITRLLDLIAPFSQARLLNPLMRLQFYLIVIFGLLAFDIIFIFGWWPALVGPSVGGP